MSDTNHAATFQPVVSAERLAQLMAHRACHSAEHDPLNGRIHGYCMVCGIPWPCEYAGTPPALSARASAGEGVPVLWVSRHALQQATACANADRPTVAAVNAWAWNDPQRLAGHDPVALYTAAPQPAKGEWLPAKEGDRALGKNRGAAAPQPQEYPELNDEELPGMWERADLIGGKTDSTPPAHGDGEVSEESLRAWRKMADEVHGRFFWMLSPDKHGNHTVSHESVRAVVELCEEIEAGTPAYENLTTRPTPEAEARDVKLPPGHRWLDPEIDMLTSEGAARLPR